jgi:hypothetical protein
VLFSRTVTVEDGQSITQLANGYFNTLPVHVAEGQLFDLTQACVELNGKCENFTARGSGYSFESFV